MRETSKYHRNLWLNRVVHRKHHNTEGKLITADTFEVRLAYLKRREHFNLNTANKNNAAVYAKEIYAFLKVNGWEETLRKYKPEALPQKEDPTVGEFLKELRDKCTLRTMTLHNYITKFKTLVKGCLNLKKPHEAYYVKSQAYADWIAGIHAIKLSKLTPQKIQAWKKQRIDEAQGNPAQERSTRRTINGILLCTKSLFAPKVVRNLAIKVSADFLDGIDMEYAPVSRYHSKMPDLRKLFEAAADKLASEQKPIAEKTEREKKEPSFVEPFKILLLALGSGLRRNEIDKLRWEQIDFEKGVVRIEINEYSDLKTLSSAGEVKIAVNILERLRKYKDEANSAFVIDSNGALKGNSPTYYHYRCANHFNRLTRWLRDQGINSNKPVHELRKEYGSLICAEFGIFIASRQLRHSSIAITNSYYVDQKEKAVVNLPL